jgi:hypothetical protein
MLDSLDVLIGFALVMLVLSTGVTLLTQMAANLVNLRGQTLRSGIATLLQQIDPALQGKLAEQIAEAVLRHPLVSGPPSWLGKRLPKVFGSGLGTVVSREELVQILLSLADPKTSAQLIAADASTQLSAALKAAGVADPAATLEDIRGLALKLEQAHPDWAAHVRASAATIGVAAGRFTATLHASFDNGMQRVRDLFVARTRWVTVACALVVTLAVPLDAVKLLRCLWVDPELRQALATQGLKTAGQEQAPSADSWAEFSKKIADLRVAVLAPDATKATLDANLKQLQAAAADRQRQVDKAEGGPTAPTPGCSADDLLTPGQWPHPFWPAVPGLVLTWMLLSLGAPFWFDALKSLAKLRPILAGPEDRERADRASGPPPAPPAAGASPSAPATRAGGEAGDLGATGAAG